MMPDKPHLSPSSLALLSRCGEAWRRRYVEGERIPPGVAQLRGSGVHAGIAENFEQKIESHEDLPLQDIIDAAVAGFEERVNSDGYELTSDEASVGASKVIGEAKDATARLASCHADTQAPVYQPVLVEQKLRVPLPNASHDLLGVVDLVDERNVVPDFKTSARRKSQGDVDTSLQLTYYAAAVQLHTGKPVPEVRLDVIVDLAKGPVRQMISSTRGPDDFQVLVNRVNAALTVIEAGAFTPTDPSNWWCSERWCGFASTCPFFRRRS